MNKKYPIKLSLMFFLIGLFLFGHKLNFNGFVHPDEPTKVYQIIEGEYNFHHPLLMLNSVRLIVEKVGGAKNYDFVMLVGRWSSAVFSAVAIALLVLSTGRLYGNLIALASGFFILSNPQLFDLAHYFKEDPSLLFGISLTLLSIVVYGDKRTPYAAAFLGVAAALAFSAKYAGIIVVPFVIFVIFANSSDNKWRDFALMLVLFLICYALVNLPAFFSFNQLMGSFDNEIVRLSAEKSPDPRSVPHGVYFKTYWENASPVLVGLLGVRFIQVVQSRFRLSPAEWVFLLLPIIYLLIISFIPTVTKRYLLPISILFACASAAGLKPFLNYKYARSLVAGLVIFSLFWQAPTLYRFEESFSCDHNSQVLKYIEKNLPPESHVLVDDFNGLPKRLEGTPKIECGFFSPEDTLYALRSRGITHVVVTQRRHRHFFGKTSKARIFNDEDTLKLRYIYEDIFNHTTLLRGWEKGFNSYLQAEFRIFDIQAIK